MKLVVSGSRGTQTFEKNISMQNCVDYRKIKWCLTLPWGRGVSSDDSNDSSNDHAK
jgi:hypothetical protein